MAIEVGDRVYVPHESAYGYVTGETFVGIGKTYAYRVRLDGVTLDIGCDADDLYPVDVTVLEGTAYADYLDEGGRDIEGIHVGGKGVVAALVDYINDEVRITIERIKR